MTDAASPSLLGRVRRKFKAARQQRRFRSSLSHLSGPKHPTENPDAVTVVALVRDGMFYLEEFLSHYRTLGAARFVFCDNGSTDGTLERLAREPDCSVIQSRLPWGEVENDFRHHAAKTYCPDRWCLFADMDEIFTFDGADQIGLPGLTRYLSDHGYTALIAQMLEMFPKMPLREAGHLPYAKALETFDHYDLGDITAHPYRDANIGFAWFLQNNALPRNDIDILFGGTRARVFGEQCCLTKHPLVRVTGDVEPGVHPHAASNVVCADFTALIKHYKFANAPETRDADTVARKAIPHGEDAKRLDLYASAPKLTLWSPEAETFQGLKPLYDAGFLKHSENYATYLAEVTK